MVLLISYDLDGHERPSAYRAVAEVIEANAIAFRRPLYSQWLVETNDDVDTWQRRLASVIDQGDKLLILQARQRVNGWLPKHVWNWLNSRI